jgi:predicted nucleic acid-binding protein
MYVLDTSAVLELLYSSKKGEKVAGIIRAKDVALTAFTVHELLIGLKAKEIDAMHALFAQVDVFGYGAFEAAESASLARYLKQSGKTIQQVDLFIASICLVHKHTLLTCDAGFRHVPYLSLKLV